MPPASSTSPSFSEAFRASFGGAAEFNKQLSAVHRIRSLTFAGFEHSRYSVAHPLTGCLPSKGEGPAGYHRAAGTEFAEAYVSWYPHFPLEGQEGQKPPAIIKTLPHWSGSDEGETMLMCEIFSSLSKDHKLLLKEQGGGKHLTEALSTIHKQGLRGEALTRYLQARPISTLLQARRDDRGGGSLEAIPKRKSPESREDKIFPEKRKSLAGKFPVRKDQKQKPASKADRARQQQEPQSQQRVSEATPASKHPELAKARSWASDRRSIKPMNVMIKGMFGSKK
jgi:hypothetical protein